MTDYIVAATYHAADGPRTLIARVPATSNVLARGKMRMWLQSHGMTVDCILIHATVETIPLLSDIEAMMLRQENGKEARC